jgi:hypothetical protein
MSKLGFSVYPVPQVSTDVVDEMKLPDLMYAKRAFTYFFFLLVEIIYEVLFYKYLFAYDLFGINNNSDTLIHL